MLRSIPEIQLQDVVLGQYVGNENGKGSEKLGYLGRYDCAKGIKYANICMCRIENQKRKMGMAFLLFLKVAKVVISSMFHKIYI